MKFENTFHSGHPRAPRGGKGFTRVDLLTLIAVAACVALITRASIASAGRADSQAVCLQNLKELMAGWTAYANDHDGAIVDPVKWTGGQWLNLPVKSVEEIDPYAPQGIASSPLWSYIGDKPEIWRCPEDKTTGSLPNYQNGAPAPRVRSYGMNNWAGGSVWAGQKDFKVYKKLDEFQVPGPSSTFILIGERPGSIGDGYFAVDMTGFNPASSENPKARMVDYPASYHSGGAAVSYVDGRAEVQVWKDARTVPAGDPHSVVPLNVTTPNNPDVHWLQFRATRRVEQVDALRFGPAQMNGSYFRMGIRIQDNREYDFETSADLMNWKSVDVKTFSNGAVEATVSNEPTQFFRARRRE